MIKLENYEVVGWEHAIRGMRNPMNSWERSDSFYTCSHGGYPCSECIDRDGCKRTAIYNIGLNDHELMMKLAKGGPVHAKYRRMITVYVDITAPLYWWKEFDTYKVGTVANSCSTMHKIHEKEFTLEDFSTEHLLCDDTDHDVICPFEAGVYFESRPPLDENLVWSTFFSPIKTLELTIRVLNANRRAYLLTRDKRYWWQMIQLLPTSYNQKRTVMLNYEVLANIYHSRKHHKLDEWHTFCDFIESLPYSEIITGVDVNDANSVGTGNLNKKPDFTNHDGSHDYD